MDGRGEEHMLAQTEEAILDVLYCMQLNGQCVSVPSCASHRVKPTTTILARRDAFCSGLLLADATSYSRLPLVVQTSSLEMEHV